MKVNRPRCDLKKSVKGILTFFFFFKQKTAYEMTCDWSSDVCSSDLVPLSPLTRRCIVRLDADFGVYWGTDHGVWLRMFPGYIGFCSLLHFRWKEAPLFAVATQCQLIQIGRASCRERV